MHISRAAHVIQTEGKVGANRYDDEWRGNPVDAKEVDGRVDGDGGGGG